MVGVGRRSAALYLLLCIYCSTDLFLGPFTGKGSGTEVMTVLLSPQPDLSRLDCFLDDREFVACAMQHECKRNSGESSLFMGAKALAHSGSTAEPVSPLLSRV